MSTNEEQACRACGEPASAHPTEPSWGTCRAHIPPPSRGLPPMANALLRLHVGSDGLTRFHEHFKPWTERATPTQDTQRLGWLLHEVYPNTPADQLAPTHARCAEAAAIIAEWRVRVPGGEELPDIRALVDARDGESTRVAVARLLSQLRAGLHEVVVALFPEVAPQFDAMPAEAAFAAMVGAARGLHRTVKEANAREQTAAVERDRARQERDNARAQLEAQPFSAEQTIRLAYLVGCERVPMDRLGDAILARLEERAQWKDEAPRCESVQPDRALSGAIRCSRAAGHRGVHRHDASSLCWGLDEPLHEGEPVRMTGAPQGTVPGYVEREVTIKLALNAGPSVSADELRRIFTEAFSAQTNLREPAQELSSGRADAQGLASLRAELTALGKHVEDVERRAYRSPTVEELNDFRAGVEHWQSAHAAVSGRLGELVGAIRDANAGWAGTAARVERLENWRRRVSKQFGPEAEGGPLNGALLADNARLEAERDAALAELKRRPNVDQLLGKFTHLADLKRGDWAIFDGAPREVVGLSPTEVVFDVHNAPVRIMRTGPALRLVWRPVPRE